MDKWIKKEEERGRTLFMRCFFLPLTLFALFSSISPFIHFSFYPSSQTGCANGLTRGVECLKVYA